MPLSKNINTYADIKAVLDVALAHGGGRYKLSTEGQAIRFRQRAYQFRNLAQRAAIGANKLPGYTPPTPYDMMLLRIEGNVVVIGVAEQPLGELLLPDGRHVRPQIFVNKGAPEVQPEDDILNEAALLALKEQEEKE